MHGGTINKMVPNVVKNAHEILDMYDELLSLRAEVTRLREVEKQYDQLLRSSIKHNDEMMGHLLVAILTGNIKAKEEGTNVDSKSNE